MKKTHAAAIVGTAAILAILLWAAPNTASYSPTPDEKTDQKPALTHAQEVWLHALEWCESNGRNDAVNPEDLDGTPSYGAFQFKPSTFEYYADLYGVPTTTLMDYATQKAVVTEMILHRDEIRWTQQFPWCVKKLGPPPSR